MVTNFSLLPGKLASTSSIHWLEPYGSATRVVRVETKASAWPTFANGGPLQIEILEWDQARKREAEWHDLVDRCLEPNPFLEPAFALSGAQQ